MTFYSLEDDELVLLDGRCRAKIQTDVDAAKARLAMASRLGTLTAREAGLVADIVTEAAREGRLTFVRSLIRYCNVCQRDAGYALYKAGRNKGRPNHGRPLTLSAVDLGRGFVTVQHSVAVGCCSACWEKIAPSVREALADVQAQIPEEITGRPPQWMKHENMKCNACGWEGHEGEMGRLRTLFGDGTYAGECPSCHAKNLALGRAVIDRSKGFTVVPTVLCTPHDPNTKEDGL